ncbi:MULTISPECIES: ABC transporter ATP-binding protein [Rhodococcus]|uniref:ABC transporter ATP-binding protein n=1 Tax=Rhodococcus TaxID=1827 RepID=UPI0004C385B9|nr:MULTISPECIES: ABC transporter ATP-binding protein [Rhodococcus]MCJ0946653.1 ABC transporter ATP-binding protein [Rhodococcus sp. ARC_M8]QEX11619.1 ABC transporter ATP-binding protein [Rhodococcus erythropolis]UKO84040.1 ABC transporter ATP-binding protein [Rhodococcus erythropolis]ULD41134.1 ABC transporter ATP-binding protein [Rhodococcus qingshengii]BBE46207.1 multidrug ABC transporter ATP-binding protein [Rhodococcus erythropolis]
MTTTPAIDIRGLRVVRGKHEVLHSLDLQVPAGSITGLLGPSGCGKTTLMRAIVGTQIVESGEVRVLGDLAGSVALRHRVGYVTQSPSVYGDLTVTRNVQYFGALYGKSGADVAAAVDAVGLSRYADQTAADLSGGQRGRVSLACALVASPDVLILDEPTVGLDPVLRVELWERFADLARSGTTLLVSSHVMDEADHCAELILMRDGHLLAQLTPDELRAKTRCERLEDAFLELIRTSPVGGEIS